MNLRIFFVVTFMMLSFESRAAYSWLPVSGYDGLAACYEVDPLGNKVYPGTAVEEENCEKTQPTRMAWLQVSGYETLSCYQIISSGLKVNPGYGLSHKLCETSSPITYKWIVSNTLASCYEVDSRGIKIHPGAKVEQEKCKLISPTYYSWFKSPKGSMCFEVTSEGKKVYPGYSTSSAPCNNPDNLKKLEKINAESLCRFEDDNFALSTFGTISKTKIFKSSSIDKSVTECRKSGYSDCSVESNPYYKNVFNPLSVFNLLNGYCYVPGGFCIPGSFSVLKKGEVRGIKYKLRTDDENAKIFCATLLKCMSTSAEKSREAVSKYVKKFNCDTNKSISPKAAIDESERGNSKSDLKIKVNEKSKGSSAVSQ